MQKKLLRKIFVFSELAFLLLSMLFCTWTFYLAEVNDGPYSSAAFEDKILYPIFVTFLLISVIMLVGFLMTNKIKCVKNAHIYDIITYHLIIVAGGMGLALSIVSHKEYPIYIFGIVFCSLVLLFDILVMIKSLINKFYIMSKATMTDAIIISNNYADSLRELKKLYDEGIISEEEFEKKKKQILDI